MRGITAALLIGLSGCIGPCDGETMTVVSWHEDNLVARTESFYWGLEGQGLPLPEDASGIAHGTVLLNVQYGNVTLIRDGTGARFSMVLDPLRDDAEWRADLQAFLVKATDLDADERANLTAMFEAVAPSEHGGIPAHRAPVGLDRLRLGALWQAETPGAAQDKGDTGIHLWRSGRHTVWDFQVKTASDSRDPQAYSVTLFGDGRVEYALDGHVPESEAAERAGEWAREHGLDASQAQVERVGHSTC